MRSRTPKSAAWSRIGPVRIVFALAFRRLQVAEGREDTSAQLAAYVELVQFRFAGSIHALSVTRQQMNVHHPNRMKG